MSGSKKPNSTYRLLAICGIISPLLWNFLVYTLGAFYPNYNHVLQYQSELGAIGSPVAWLFNPLGFGLTGILGIAFAYGLYRGGAGRIDSALWAIAFSALIWLGIWPLGPGLTFQMHVWGFYVLAIAWALSLFAFSVSLRRNKQWRSLWKYTLVFAVVGVILLILHQSGVFEPMHGFTQRIWGNWYMLWGFIMAIKLYRLS